MISAGNANSAGNAISAGYMIWSAYQVDVFTLASIETAPAGKCQYYQLRRRNSNLAALWSDVYQTVLVETLGEQGDKLEFSPEQFSDPVINFTTTRGWVYRTNGEFSEIKVSSLK